MGRLHNFLLISSFQPEKGDKFVKEGTKTEWAYSIVSREKKYITLDGYYFSQNSSKFIGETCYIFDENGMMKDIIIRCLDQTLEPENEPEINHDYPGFLDTSKLKELKRKFKEFDVEFDTQQRRVICWY
jgi:hypothetical protein